MSVFSCKTPRGLAKKKVREEIPGLENTGQGEGKLEPSWPRRRQTAPLVLPCGRSLHTLKLFKKSCEWREAGGRPSGLAPRSQAQSAVPGGQGGRVQRKELGPSLVLPPGQRQIPVLGCSRPPGGPKASPCSPTVRGGEDPMQSGANSGRGKGLGERVTAPQISKRPRRLGALHCLDCVCACVRVYLPSNLSVYGYVCGNVGATEAEGRGGGTFSRPRFLARGWGGPPRGSVAGRRAGRPLSKGRCT